MSRAQFAVLAAAAVLMASPALPANPPAEWDGLVAIPSKKVDKAYLAPGADFRAYTKVMLDPTEVAFNKHWQRDYNAGSVGLSNRITDAEAREIASRVRAGFEQILANAYTHGGYAVVTEPGPDVLRLRTGVINLKVTAPDQMNPGMVRTYARDAGEATVVIEARDSLTGALLGRAVDQRTAGDIGPWVRDAVGNRADFEQLFARWSKISVDGLNELKARSPVQAASR